jgi:uncharacterized protein
MNLDSLRGMIQEQFALNWYGMHGILHWQRVKENGLRLAELTQANKQVVELFAYLHDSRRMNEGLDRQHGKRAAKYVTSLNGLIINLPTREFDRLAYACRNHSDGLTEADITIQTCWDADRLDLGRVGITPEPQYLCTDAAKDPKIIEWAYRRSQDGYTNENQIDQPI